MEGGPGNVSDLLRRLRPELAYTTVMTELAMLHRIGLADRQKEGRGYRYEARMDRDQLRQAMATELATQLREDFGEYARSAKTGSRARAPRRKRQSRDPRNE
jgi:predicted transcriptional regulator